MSLRELRKSIRRGEAKIVVIGLGYVGLPVACLFAKSGFPVVGIDRSLEKTNLINRGICPIKGKEAGLLELVAEATKNGHFKATTDYTECRDAKVILVAVETPVDKRTKVPAYEALNSALESLAQNLRPGTLVIIESTLAPRTMERIVRLQLEQISGLKVNEDFYLANCPERVMPGRLLANISGCHRVIGGMSPETAEAAAELYRSIVKADLDPTDCLTAEIVKTVENAYRDVQIAFANEVALLCEAMGANVWKVRELVNKSPYRAMHLPGAGVGGHCIPKDPWLLLYGAGKDFEARLIPAARAINDGMPYHIVELVQDALRRVGKEVKGARIAVLGYTYLENSDDTRNSPSVPLIERLQELGAEVTVHDPYVREYMAPLQRVVKAADCVVVMVAHDEYRQLSLEQFEKWLTSPVVVDGRNVFTGQLFPGSKLVYRALGDSHPA